jgi:hypothetical protein
MSEKWKPFVTSETRKFLDLVPFLLEGDAERIISEAQKILSLGADPTLSNDSKSVLVVGEVQSGKTLSFTTNIQLARENGFQLTVVVAGTKKNLRDQTYDRLKTDLSKVPFGATIWRAIKNPGPKHLAEIQDDINSWSDVGTPFQYRVSPVLVVMKTKASLLKLTLLLSALQESHGVVPTLVVDDEADQAGLNVALEKDIEKSKVYEALERVRASCPVHTFLLYTATSQAIALVDLTDHMSPNHVVVLETGSAYVGASELLAPDKSHFYQEIPSWELADAQTPLPGTAAPESLRDSLAYFYLAGVVAIHRQNPKQVSMLIHPDLLKVVHSQYKSVLEDLQREFLRVLDMDIGIEGQKVGFESIFSGPLAILEKTVDVKTSLGIHTESEMLAFFLEHIPYWIRKTQVRVINSSQNSVDVKTSDWEKHQFWILIGASKMERGFTIENLICTYMPRGVGMGMADNVQQRGRFFGNKRAYLDLLRGWMSEETFSFLSGVAEMESLLKRELKDVENSGESLKTWSRRLVLSPGMKATRDAAISLQGLFVTVLKGGFRFTQTHLFTRSLLDEVTFRANREIIKPYFQASQHFSKDTRTRVDTNKSVVLPIAELIDLISRWMMSRADRNTLSGLLLGLRYYADKHPNAKAGLVFMDNLQPRRRAALLTNETAANFDFLRIKALQQGRDTNTTYRGDAAMVWEDAVTVQIHHVVPTVSGTELPGVLALAVYWPLEFEKVVFHQGNMSDQEDGNLTT